MLLALIDKGLVREEAYDTVQPKAMKAWELQVPFRSLIEADEKITSLAYHKKKLMIVLITTTI